MEKTSQRSADLAPAGQNVDARATVGEHELSFWAAVQLYPAAIFWSLFFCLSVVIAGFDGQIITSLFAQPAFQRTYGEAVAQTLRKPDNSSNGTVFTVRYEVSAPWQTGLGMGNPIGQVVGALACGYPLQQFGRRATLAACCVWSIALVSVQVFATSVGILCVGEVLAGLAYGFYVVIAPTYASEICPVVLRGALTASVNLAFVIGQLIAQGVAASVESRSGEWAYRAPFAVQWLWPVILLAGLAFAPESPYWLIRRGQKTQARRALEKLTSARHNGAYIDRILQEMEQTDRLERENENCASYLDCFRGTNLVRTEISIMVYLIQVISGNPLIGYANYFFEQTGLASSKAFDMGVGNTALGLVGTILSWPLMNFFCFGRRKLYSLGLALMTILLLIIGALSIPREDATVSWALASLMDVWTLIYQTSVGPVCFVILAETSATRMRERTIALATAVQAAANIVTMVAMPVMLNSNRANWGAKTGFLFAGIGALCLVWCFFRLPETRDRTFEELDLLFQRRVPLRRFADYDFDI